VPAPDAGRAEVLVSAGGGAVGRRLLQTAMQARGRTLLRGATWRVLSGVHCSDADFRLLERDAVGGIVLERSRADFAALLANCALSISQAGYNTVAETLKARVRAVLVPFAGGAESEQTLRARLLAQRGAVEVVEESALSAETLAIAVDRAVRRDPPAGDLVDLDGGRRTAQLLKEWLS
jgi:predicted glycosyltransferase